MSRQIALCLLLVFVFATGSLTAAEPAGFDAAETRINARPTAPRVGVVNNIVVNQSRRVQHLHHGRQSDDIFTVRRAINRVICQQKQRGTNALAARRTKIIAQIIDNLNVRGGLPFKFHFDQNHFSFDKTENLFRRDVRI